MSIITPRGVPGTGGAKLKDAIRPADRREFRAAGLANGYDGVGPRDIAMGQNTDERETL